MRINSRGSWILKDPNRHTVSRELAEALIDFAQTSNVIDAVDLGCGNGGYVKSMIDMGVECVGYDGNPHTPEITDGLCKTLDLSSPISIGRYDLVICLEVGEHVPEKYENILLDNLAKTADRFLVLSWAIPGQRGTGHVNCKSNEYIAKELSRRGFKLTDDYKALRESVVGKKFGHFKNTILTFMRER